MGMLMLTLFEIGLKIAAARVGGDVEEIAKIPKLMRQMVVAVDDLYKSEVGQPIDWSRIREHDHLE